MRLASPQTDDRPHRRPAAPASRLPGLPQSQDPLGLLWLMTAEWPEPMPRAAAASIMFAVAWPKSYISQSRCRASSGSLATRAIGAADWRCASRLGPRLSPTRPATRGPLRPRNSTAASFPRVMLAARLKDAQGFRGRSAGRCTGVGCGAPGWHPTSSCHSPIARPPGPRPAITAASPAPNPKRAPRARPGIGSARWPTARSASPPVTARRAQHLPAVRGGVDSGRGW